MVLYCILSFLKNILLINGNMFWLRLLDWILYMYMVCFMCCLFVRCFGFEFGLLCLKWKGQISDSAWKILISGDAFQVSCRVSGDGLISFDLPFAVVFCWSPRNQHHMTYQHHGEGRENVWGLTSRRWKSTVPQRRQRTCLWDRRSERLWKNRSRQAGVVLTKKTSRGSLVV